MAFCDPYDALLIITRAALNRPVLLQYLKIPLIVHGNVSCQNRLVRLCPNRVSPYNAHAMLPEIPLLFRLLQVHRSQTQDLGPLHVTELASHDT